MKKLILFSINNQNYGIDIDRVNAIETAIEITASPNMPQFMLGMINLRGTIIPIVSLRNKFGYEEIPVNHSTQYLIVMQGGSLIGFKVDAVSEIVELSDDKIQSMPMMLRGTDTNYAKDVASVKGKLVIMIDIDGVLSQAEIKMVEEVLNSAG